MRLYGWLGRWLSIGLAQSIADVDRAACVATGTGIVRRPSGGTAVLHVDHMAWSLVLPSGHALAPPDIVESYRLHAEIALDLCRSLGVTARAVDPDEARVPPSDAVLAIACFGGLAPHEIVIGQPARKVVGWGQVRRRGVVMHHAVLARRFDPMELARLLSVDRSRLAAALASRVAGLDEAARGRPTVGEIAAALIDAHTAGGLSLAPGNLSAAERARARALVRERYARDGWTNRR
jgi:lipoate-protein ligase A